MLDPLYMGWHIIRNHPRNIPDPTWPFAETLNQRVRELLATSRLAWEFVYTCVCTLSSSLF